MARSFGYAYTYFLHAILDTGKNDASDGRICRRKNCIVLHGYSLADTRPQAQHYIVPAVARMYTSHGISTCFLPCYTAAQLVCPCFRYLLVDMMAFSHAACPCLCRFSRLPHGLTILPHAPRKLTNVIDRDPDHQWHRAQPSPVHAPPPALPFPLPFAFPFWTDDRTSSSITARWNEWKCSRYILRP